MITDQQYREYMAQKNSAIPCENALPEAYDMTAEQQIRAKALEAAVQFHPHYPQAEIMTQVREFECYIREGK